MSNGFYWLNGKLCLILDIPGFPPELFMPEQWMGAACFLVFVALGLAMVASQDLK